MCVHCFFTFFFFMQWKLAMQIYRPDWYLLPGRWRGGRKQVCDNLQQQFFLRHGNGGCKHDREVHVERVREPDSGCEVYGLSVFWTLCVVCYVDMDIITILCVWWCGLCIFSREYCVCVCVRVCVCMCVCVCVWCKKRVYLLRVVLFISFFHTQWRLAMQIYGYDWYLLPGHRRDGGRHEVHWNLFGRELWDQYNLSDDR
jgi:hypothetical protein